MAMVRRATSQQDTTTMATGYDDKGDGATGEQTNKQTSEQTTQTNKRTNERTNIRQTNGQSNK